MLSNFEIQWDRYIAWLSFASRRLYNILYFLWLYNEFFIILYNILKIAGLDYCQIIILSIYVPSTHAYTHVLRLSLDLPYEKRYHYDYWSSFFQGVDVFEWTRAMNVKLSEWCCSVSMLWVQIPLREEHKIDSSKI
jgi:hypothetical protein